MLRAAHVGRAVSNRREVDASGGCHDPASQGMLPLGCSHKFIMTSCTASLRYRPEVPSQPMAACVPLHQQKEAKSPYRPRNQSTVGRWFWSGHLAAQKPVDKQNVRSCPSQQPWSRYLQMMPNECLLCQRFRAVFVVGEVPAGFGGSCSWQSVVAGGEMAAREERRAVRWW